MRARTGQGVAEVWDATDRARVLAELEIYSAAGAEIPQGQLASSTMVRSQSLQCCDLVLTVLLAQLARRPSSGPCKPSSRPRRSTSQSPTSATSTASPASSTSSISGSSSRASGAKSPSSTSATTPQEAPTTGKTRPSRSSSTGSPRTWSGSSLRSTS